MTGDNLDFQIFGVAPIGMRDEKVARLLQFLISVFRLEQGPTVETFKREGICFLRARSLQEAKATSHRLQELGADFHIIHPKGYVVSEGLGRRRPTGTHPVVTPRSRRPTAPLYSSVRRPALPTTGGGTRAPAPAAARPAASTTRRPTASLYDRPQRTPTAKTGKELPYAPAPGQQTPVAARPAPRETEQSRQSEDGLEFELGGDSADEFIFEQETREIKLEPPGLAVDQSPDSDSDFDLVIDVMEPEDPSEPRKTPASESSKTESGQSIELVKLDDSGVLRSGGR